MLLEEFKVEQILSGEIGVRDTSLIVDAAV